MGFLSDSNVSHELGVNLTMCYKLLDTLSLQTGFQEFVLLIGS